MPFLAPVIAGAIGAGVVGQAIIGAALAGAMALAARALAPKPREHDTSGRGMRLNLRLDPNAPREIVIGEAATAGTLVYHHVHGGSGNDDIDLVYAISDCPCDSLLGVWINGEWKDIDGNGNVDGYGTNLRFQFYSGAEDQAAAADLITNSGGRWTSANQGKGIAYVYVWAHFDQEQFQAGLPRFLFKVRGARLYDWRKDSSVGGSGAHRWGELDTYEWTDNPVVILYNYRRGIRLNGEHVGGMNTPPAAMPLADWTSAAGICDELVGTRNDGDEKRYRANGVISLSSTHREVVTDLVTAMAGREVNSGGVLRPLPGAGAAAVMTITDGDILVDSEVWLRPKRPRSQLVNAVFGSYHDPDQNYESVAAPPRISSLDAATDGGVRLTEHYALDYVTSPTQAQRVMEIMRRRGRYQSEVRVKLRAEFGLLEAGDWITWTSDRYGWSAQPFEVVSVSVEADWSATVTLRETSSSIYTWTPAVDELDPLAPADVSPGGSTVDRVQGLQAQTFIAVSGETQRPGIRALWSPINDPSVVDILFQYRQVGSSDVLEYVGFDPTSGQVGWFNGVLGDADYEVRAKPVTIPPRPVVWTSWVAATEPTDPFIVSAPLPPPGSIGPDYLDAQTRFEIALATGLDSVLGSAGALYAEMLELTRAAGETSMRELLRSLELEEGVRTETLSIRTEHESLQSIVTEVVAEFEDPVTGLAAAHAAIVDEQTARATAIDAEATARLALAATVNHPTTGLAAAHAAVVTEAIARAAGDAAEASARTTLATTVNGNTASITTLQSSVNGIHAQWLVAIDVAGRIAGIRLANGTNQSSTFDVLADNFRVSSPSSGGGAVPVFAIGTSDGVTRMGFRGDMFLDGTILARHINALTLSAITANLGEITAGLLRSSDNKFRIDLNAKTLTIET